MGSHPAVDREAAKGELPQHRVYLAEFYLGKVPVTNAQYAAFVQSAGCEAPSYWDREGIPSDKGDHPVVQVSWRDARAFCDWLNETTGLSFRLPTEAEWEKTARGANGRTYPRGGPSVDGGGALQLRNARGTHDPGRSVSREREPVRPRRDWTWPATPGSGPAASTGPIRIERMMAGRIRRPKGSGWCGVGLIT